jgi:hypothetical protein
MKNGTREMERLTCNDDNWIRKIFGGTTDESKSYRIG